MNILFIQPPLGDGTTRMPLSQRLFPWGLATVARCLADDGHKIEVLDVYAQNLVRAEVSERLDAQRPEAACITGFSSINYLYVRWLAEEIKARYSIPVVVGGVLADHHHDLLLKAGTVDYCVLGEGELTAVDLFRHLDRPEQVKGIAYRRGGELAVTEPRELIRRLDDLPLPDFDIWDMAAYSRVKMYVHDPSTSFDFIGENSGVNPEDLRPNMSFVGGRGCPYRCTFCSRSYDQVRVKSVDRIISEIKLLQARLGLKAAHFADELLLLNRRRTLEFCQKIKPLGLRWDGQGRVNSVDREIVAALKDAGCLSMGLGVESGSDRMLTAMRKNITRAQSLTALTAAREAGLHLKIQLMGGFPGEDQSTLAETASLIRAAKLPPRRLTWCTPLPGSSLYRQAREQGLIPDEEAYIIKLHKGYNHPGAVVLNVSGQSDEAMARLFQWVEMRMDRDFILTWLEQGGALNNPRFWSHVLSTLDKMGAYYAPGLTRLTWLRKTLRGLLSLVKRAATGSGLPGRR